MTKEEFKIQFRGELEGEIRAYKHMLNLCKMVLKDRRKRITKKEIERVAKLNDEFWTKK